MERIFINQLAQLFQRILDKLKSENVTSIDIEDDLYRIIPTYEWGKFEKDVIVVGSLEDDIESLRKLLDDPERPCTYVDFDRLASVLRAISEVQNPGE